MGVPQGADNSQIKKAYFKLAKELHPDVNKAPDAKEKFSEISEYLLLYISNNSNNFLNKFIEPMIH